MSSFHHHHSQQLPSSSQRFEPAFSLCIPLPPNHTHSLYLRTSSSQRISSQRTTQNIDPACQRTQRIYSSKPATSDPSLLHLRLPTPPRRPSAYLTSSTVAFVQLFLLISFLRYFAQVLLRTYPCCEKSKTPIVLTRLASACPPSPRRRQGAYFDTSNGLSCVALSTARIHSISCTRIPRHFPLVPKI